MLLSLCYTLDAKRLPETDGRKFGSSAQLRLWHGYEFDSIGALAVSEEGVRMLFEDRTLSHK